MRRHPVLYKADDRVGCERVLATVLRGPRLSCIGIAHRVAQDDHKVGVRVERLRAEQGAHSGSSCTTRVASMWQPRRVSGGREQWTGVLRRAELHLQVAHAQDARG